MNYLDNERLDALASDYVMGTMTGQARKRFLRLMQKKAKVRERVWWWEQMLDPMNDRLAPAEPPAHLWQGICAKLGLEDTTVVPFPGESNAKPVERVTPVQPAANDDDARWRPWAGGFATAAALLLTLYFGIPQQDAVVDQVAVEQTTVNQAVVEQMAVFSTEEGQPLWLVDVRADDLRLRATANVTQSTEFDYELWMIPADGGAPQSLGLMPEQGETVRLYSADLSAQAVSAIAISREAPGGSVTGAPGEVLYVTQLTRT